MGDEDERWDWHDQPAMVWAAGAAAAALIAMLVFAVLQTSDSSHAPDFVSRAPATDGSSGSVYTTSPTSTTSYPVPSVQTSQDTGAPVTTGAPSTDDPSDDDDATTTTSTTIYNSYGTTTPTNAGHV